MKYEFYVDRLVTARATRYDHDAKKYVPSIDTTAHLKPVGRGPDAENYVGTPWEGERSPLGGPDVEIALGRIGQKAQEMMKVGNTITVSFELHEDAGL